jgi:hypothetical protein
MSFCAQIQADELILPIYVSSNDIVGLNKVNESRTEINQVKIQYHLLRVSKL